MKRNNHLVLFDFDKTLADTSKNDTGGIDVEEATGLAVEELFGGEGYEYFVSKLGGLQNREPGELVGLLLQELRFTEVDLKSATELFVQGKLSYLLESITPDWPQLYPGVKDFFQDVSSGGIPVDVGIVSSGHDEFINKVFKVNDLDVPEILVTSDILRERYNPYALPRHKPNPYQIAVAHRLWLNGKSEDELHKEGMVYVGDDPIKDGCLAERSRIPFIYVPFSGKVFNPDKDKGQIAVSNFGEIGELLKQNKAMLESGVSMTEILVGKPYYEVFGRGQEGNIHNRMLRENGGNSFMMRR